MKVAGIICEYNPFHNGHLYQIEQTRKEATHIVCAMSGNFVQRGDLAIVDKWTRAKIAVLCGADLVVEIPTPWACSSAENFARGGVHLLASIGADILSFGCENPDSRILKKAAEAVDAPMTGELIKAGMSKGLTYPAALRRAVAELFGNETAKVFDSPNNTLAVEYIRQSKKLGVSLDFLPIKRSKAQHAEEKLFYSSIASAAALRNFDRTEEIKNYIPDDGYEVLSELERAGLYPYRTGNAERVLLAFLRRMQAEEMIRYVSDENGLAQRLYRASRTADSFDELISNVKVKNVTLAAVRRAVFSCFLKIPCEIAAKLPVYIRILAMNKRGAEIIRNSNCPLPIITRHSQSAALSDFGREIYNLECSCTDIYSLFSKKISDCSREQTSPIFIKD